MEMVWRSDGKKKKVGDIEVKNIASLNKKSITSWLELWNVTCYCQIDFTEKQSKIARLLNQYTDISPQK